MGLLRLFLALSVVAGHTQTTIFGFKGVSSFYAVNFFFIISGFYMAMILNGKYKDTNPIYFYKSRAFRLFPAYYVGVFISLLILFGIIGDFFDQLSIGAKFYYIFQNIFIFGQDLSYLFCVKAELSGCVQPGVMTINPPAWSLAVELGFYLVAPYILKSERKTFIFVLLGCGYLLAINNINFPLDSVYYFRGVDNTAFNYYFYPSSFPFFGAGALAYHLSKWKRLSRYVIAIFFAAILAIILLPFTQTIMPLWHLLFISMAVPVLFDYTATNRVDRSIGELSYPLYILHFPVLLFFGPLTQSHPQYFNFIGLGSWVAIVSGAIGLLINFTIEKRVNKYRYSDTFFGSQPASKSNFVIRASSISLIFIYLLFPFAAIAYIYSVQHAPATTPYDLTDSNWFNGVGRKVSGFIISHSRENFDHYQTGKIIKFANGETRQIAQVEQSGQYLRVHVIGDPLDGEQVGFPNKIEIVATSYNLTDENWNHGVGRNIPGFIVSYSRENLDDYQVDKLIKFANGDTRQIIRVEQSDQYLRILMNGDILDGEKVGYPGLIEIVE